jgi:hypothetical protein
MTVEGENNDANSYQRARVKLEEGYILPHILHVANMLVVKRAAH